MDPMSARLIGRTGIARGVDRTLDQLLTVGSGLASELRIDSRTVSRRHAQIVRSGTQYYVEDLGSSNGTFLNGTRVKRFPIRHLDILSVGPEVDLIFLESGAAVPLVVRTAPLRATITWTEGSLAGSVEEVPADRGLILGRGGNTQLAGAISRRHAVLTVMGDHLTVEDLGSANGTWVNGSRISTVTKLLDGNEVSLAELMKFRVSILNAPSSRTAEALRSELPTVNVSSRLRSGVRALEVPPLGVRDQDEALPSPPASGPIDSVPPVPAPAPSVPRNEPGVQPQALDSPTTYMTREAAIAPPGLPDLPLQGGTVIAPREAAQAPGFELFPVDSEHPSTIMSPPDSEGGVPSAVFAEAMSARDAAGKVPGAQELSGSSDSAKVRSISGAPGPPPSSSGGRMSLRLDGPRQITFDCGDFSVGRDPGSDLLLESRDVGRHHARIRVSDEGVTVVDLKTANGTFVDDRRVIGESAVTSGARIRFATVEFTVELVRAEGQIP
jgi:pSer/pThr/pTyr-binding forkhead associated (FHA) protein